VSVFLREGQEEKRESKDRLVEKVATCHRLLWAQKGRAVLSKGVCG
jgi:hypothetical protein